MNGLLLKMAAGLVLLFVGVIYGFASVQFRLPPYDLARAAYHASGLPGVPNAASPKAEFLTTPVEYYETDVADLISIQHKDDLDRVRVDLIERLWGTSQLPKNQPASVANGHVDRRYGGLSSLRSIDKITVDMEFGLTSVVYHFFPKSANGDVVLFHAGHGGDFIQREREIGEFLDSGYAVVAFAMPLLGLNSQPVIDVPRIGKLKLTHHDTMVFLNPEHGHPVKYFVEPIVVVLNYLESEFQYRHYAMAGISGGGWTTTLAAALDTRIKLSFPVAGSYPIFLRSNSRRDWGDYEQTVPEIYSTANYPELYIMGAVGDGRKQVQILNQFDSCCFAGTKWDTYVDTVRERVKTLGSGEFDLFMDASHEEHMISPAGMRRILAEMREGV